MGELTFPAVRVPIEEWPRHLLPGEYCGPIMGWTGDLPAVFFVPPGAENWERCERAGRHVVSPPHTYRECVDGSLEIRNSLGCLRDDPEEQARLGYIWHGYLDEGNVWRQV